MDVTRIDINSDSYLCHKCIEWESDITAENLYEDPEISTIIECVRTLFQC